MAISTDIFKRLGEGLKHAFNGPAIEKFKTKLTSREFVAPLVYTLISVIVFALTYALIGYKNIFVTTDQNKDKNIENSITGSVMLQSNGMGSVTPINSLGNILMTVQVSVGWLLFLCIIYLIV
jgi:hypothetical protein